MSLTLSETQVIQALAAHLYDFLPGNPHPFANRAVSFAGVAESFELGDFWQGGSKKPAIIHLLELTLDRDRGKFCSLIFGIVRTAIKYKSLQREQIERLNELLLGVKFKIPELWDKAFYNRYRPHKPKRHQRPRQT